MCWSGFWRGCVLWRALAGGASPPVALERREYRGGCVLEWRELWGGLGVGGVRVRVACMQKRWQDTLSASIKTSARPIGRAGILHFVIRNSYSVISLW